MKRYGADRDKEIQRLLQEMPEEGFRLLFDVYHMQLCVYVVQLTDSFQLLCRFLGKKILSRHYRQFS